ncbi:MAG: RHS repeat domain-containing protein, partial [Bacteroidales bacterium]
YIGSQRIVSKLGDVGSFGVDPRREEYAGADISGAEAPDYKSKYEALQQVIKDEYEGFEVPYLAVDNDDYVDGEGFCCGDEMRTKSTLPADNVDYEKLQYYYHPDHLGSASYITNLDGEVVRHIEYVPFGEVFLEERNNTWNTPYLFNGKELDEETGLYYYGARYYNPRISLWYGVDPKAADASGWSPYRAFFCNPIRYTDPDGQWEWDAVGNLVAEKGDQSYSLAKFLGTSQQNAMTILGRSGVTANDKGILNLKIGQQLSKNTLYIDTKATSGKVVNNTQEATSHYLSGNGQAADVGDVSTNQLLQTSKFQAKHKKITSQEVQPTGYFSVDLTDETFHIGNTGVDYSVSGNGNSSSVNYTFFTNPTFGTDGFWDPDFIDEKVLGGWLGIDKYKPDGPGPNLERFGGTPYPYKTRERTYFFKPTTTGQE